MKKILQNLVFKPKDTEEIELYLRSTSNFVHSNSLPFLYNEGREANFSFDTYFNSFSLYKWKKYTKLDNLHLLLELKGEGVLQITGVDKENCEEQISTHNFCCTFRNVLNINIPTVNEYILVYFSITTKGCTVYKGEWATDIPKSQLSFVSLAIGICTWKREDYIYKNLEKLIDFRNKYTEYCDKIFIHVSDNGNTLQKEKFTNQNNIFLYTNANSGGSGGFARCMLEALEKTPSVTHMLLMDDDVAIETESIFRTLAFLEILKSEYRSHCLAGAMLNLREPCIQAVREEGFTPHPPHHRNFRPNINLTDRNELVINDGPCFWKNLYAGWWYCAFPICTLKNGLSYPLFFQLDDIEFSIRNKLEPIHLNGISVWHEPPWIKINSTKEFYITRNTLIVSSFGKDNPLVNLSKVAAHFLGQLFIFNYTAARYVIAGIEAYLAGPQCLPQKDNWTRRPQFPECAKQYPIEGKKIVRTSHKINFATLLLAAITLNGFLLPNCLLKNSEFLQGDPKNFFGSLLLKKSSRFVVNGICTEMQISRFEAIKCSIKFLSSCFSYLLLRKKITKEWIASRNSYTSIDWWKTQLLINN